MMPKLDFESDQFLSLLTEALRAGPGSPEWHESVSRLTSASSVEPQLRDKNESNEYDLLIRARENLESGKVYRSIRAGPGFTHRLMQSIEESASASSLSEPVTTWIAIFSGAVLLSAICLIVFLITRGGGSLPAVDALANTYFVNTTFNTTFDTPIASADWREIGSLRLEVWHGLRPNIDEASERQLGGGILWSQSLKPDTPVEIEATINLAKPSKDLIAQVFVTDDPESFSQDKGISPRELIWLFQAGQQKTLLPGGRVESQSAVARDRRTLNLRIALDRDVATVEEQGKRLWAGAHGLSNKQRFIGIRFLRTSSERDDPGIAFTSMRVQTP